MKTYGGYQVEVLDTAAGFEQLRPVWLDLEGRSRQPVYTASYDWLRTWWEVFAEREDHQFGYAKRPLILGLRRAGEWVAIVPLVRLCRRWRRVLFRVRYIEFLGQQWGATLLDAVAAEPQAGLLEAVGQWLERNERFDVLNLTYLPDWTSHVALGGLGTKVFSACPILYCDQYADYEDYRKRQHARNFRKCVKKSQNGLQAAGLPLEFVLAPASEGSLAEVIRLSTSKEADGKHSLYLDRDKRRFMQAITARLNARIEFTRVGGRNAVYVVSFRRRDGLFAFDTSYDRTLRQYSLGRLALLDSVARFFAEGWGRFHCAGTGLGFHKRGHFPEVLKLYALTRAGNRWRGGLLTPRVLARYEGIEARFLVELDEWMR